MDGKTLRRSFDTATGKAAVHMVSAYVHENHSVFGQLPVDDKRNEITAIPRLLETLKLKEATVTIDVRNHWKIENQLHWILDVCFHEDSYRVCS